MITKVSGSNGTFSGEGYSMLPYIGAFPLAVTFSNINVNEENKLIGGKIESKYDAKAGGITNADVLTLGGNTKLTQGIIIPDTQVNFTVPQPVPTIKYDSTVNIITFYDNTHQPIGQVQPPLNEAGVPIFPFTLEDKTRAIYQVEAQTDPKTNQPTGKYTLTPLGKQESPLDGTLDLKNLNYLKGIVTFENNKESKYTLDEYLPYYEEVSIIKYNQNTNDEFLYPRIGPDYHVKWKYMGENHTEPIKAKLHIIDHTLLDPEKVYFKTQSGTLLNHTYHKKDHSYDITLMPGGNNTRQDLYALHPDGAKDYWVLGKLYIDTRTPQTHKVVLVDLGGNYDKSTIEKELNQIYNPVGITWEVGEYENFHVEKDTLENLFEKNSSLLDAYNEKMQSINRRFIRQLGNEYDNTACYVFIMKKSNAGNGRDIAGFMPRGNQFGYVYTDKLKPLGAGIAHELGHGKFKLCHTFDKVYGKAAVATQGTTNNLMDYSNGTHIAKWQWDQIYNPAVFNAVFDKDEEGMWTTDGHYYTVQLVALMMGLDEATALKLGKAAEEPDSYVISDMEMQERDTWTKGGLQQRYHALTGGYHGVELAVTAYAMIKTHTDETSLLYLLHRFGDNFAHFKIDHDKEGLTINVSLKNYIQAIDNYIHKLNFDSKFIYDCNLSLTQTPYGLGNLQYNIRENGKIETVFSKEELVHNFIDFLLQGIHGSHFAYTLKWETCVENILGYLPNAIQNNFRMYGADQINCFTSGHSWDTKFGDYSPDNIVERTKLYLLYTDNLIELLSIKYNVNSEVKNNIIHNKMNDLIDYVKYTTINRLDGILNYEIKKLKTSDDRNITFYIPIKYINENAASIAKSTFTPTEDADGIVADTEKYLKNTKADTKYYIESNKIIKSNIQFWEFKLTRKK